MQYFISVIPNQWGEVKQNIFKLFISFMVLDFRKERERSLSFEKS